MKSPISQPVLHWSPAQKNERFPFNTFKFLSPGGILFAETDGVQLFLLMFYPMKELQNKMGSNRIYLCLNCCLGSVFDTFKIWFEKQLFWNIKNILSLWQMGEHNPSGLNCFYLGVNCCLETIFKTFKTFL